MRIRFVWAGLMLAVAGPAAAFDDEDAAKVVAAADGARTVSVFVDVTWGARKDRAAAQLTAAHRAFGRQGWDAIDVELYVENGDLQGFFVTYRRRNASD